MTWLGLLVCTVLILYSGSRLSKYGDIIADLSGLGRAWIGLMLMATVTSLPELITNVVAVTYADVPDIAVGNVLGACVLNLTFYAVLDAAQKKTPLSTSAHHGHTLSAGFGMFFITIVAMSLFVGEYMVTFGWVGAYSVIIALVYPVAMKVIFTYEKRQLAAFVKEVAAESEAGGISLRDALIRFSLNAAVVIVAALFLPSLGEAIAIETGLGQTFVGAIFIAIATTLPEIVVSLTAVRIGAADLAIGNLLGSNIFNIVILAIGDVLYIKGPLLAHVDIMHTVPALTALAMTSIAIVGLTYRADRKRLFLSWDSIGMILCYLSNLLMLYIIQK